MDNIYSYYTKQVMNEAFNCSRRMNDLEMDSRHLLLGLLKVEDSIAFKVLKNHDISYTMFFQYCSTLSAIENSVKKIDRNISDSLATILKFANTIKAEFHSVEIETYHLLLGILSVDNSIACQFLHKHNITLIATKKEIYKLSQETKMTNKEKSTPMLDNYGTNLTKMAVQNKLFPVIGREKEIDDVIRILSRRTKNNPVLVGEPGTGKTAIVEGLAQRIVRNEVPETLLNKQVFTLEIGSLIAGTKFRGEFEERVKNIIKEITASQDFIIFIDEVHTLVGSGAAEGGLDVSNLLKPALARGEVQVVGATTLNEYRKYIEKDGALDRRFQKVMVEAPSVEETIEILRGISKEYENHHNVIYTEEALRSAAELSSRYILERQLPDKAIDLLDEAGSKIYVKLNTPSSEIISLKESIRELNSRIRTEKNPVELENLKKELQELTFVCSNKYEEWMARIKRIHPKISPQDVADVVSQWTGIELSKLNVTEGQRLLNLENLLHERVVGQNEAIEQLARAIRRNKAGLKNNKRPIGSFLFMGPTGVGKTELVKTLAECLFGDEEAMLRLDMSEFREEHSVSRLLGAPAGYIGYNESGAFESLRKKPYQVVLLDEIEKAHPKIFNILLQIFDEGRISDSKGRIISFSNSIIVLTSNIGIHNDAPSRSIGFQVGNQSEKEYALMQENMTRELKGTFRPELINRLDAIVTFHSLDEEQMLQIVNKFVEQTRSRLKLQHDINLSLDEDVLRYLATVGYHKQYGAREARRKVQELIETPLSEFVLQNPGVEDIHIFLEDNIIYITSIEVSSLVS